MKEMNDQDKDQGIRRGTITSFDSAAFFEYKNESKSRKHTAQ